MNGSSSPISGRAARGTCVTDINRRWQHAIYPNDGSHAHCELTYAGIGAHVQEQQRRVTVSGTTGSPAKPTSSSVDRRPWQYRPQNRLPPNWSFNRSANGMDSLAREAPVAYHRPHGLAPCRRRPVTSALGLTLVKARRFPDPSRPRPRASLNERADTTRRRVLQ